MIATQPSRIPEHAGSARKRIVLLTPSLARGGAEVIVTELALAIRRKGWEVAVVSMMEPTAFRDDLERCDVEVFSLGMRPGYLNAKGMVQLFRYLRRFPPNLIHAHMFHANILARLARAFLGVPVVCTIHNILESSRRSDTARFRDLVYRFTDFLSSRTTAISELVTKRYVRDGIIPASRIRAIPNFVDADMYQSDQVRRKQVRDAMKWGDRFIWLAAGRLERAKDYPNLIAAFREVKRDVPAAHLVIAGEGRLRKDIESLIHLAGIETSVSMLGERSDVPDLMKAADGFVLASAWEGMPLVLLEAASSELTCVTTDVGGAPEIILPGRTGLIVPPRDAERLSRAMIEAAKLSEDERGQLGRAARRHVLVHFSKTAVCRQYAELYQEVLISS
jgi:glycosyltransferase involved in cell wall biosynthesis